MLSGEVEWQRQSLMEQLKVKSSVLKITACMSELKLLVVSMKGLQSYFRSCSLSVSQLVFLVSFSSKGYYGMGNIGTMLLLSFL